MNTGELTFLKFGAESPALYSRYELSYDWCASLILGTGAFETVPKLLRGISAQQKRFADRQTLATDTTYVSLREKAFRCSDPWNDNSECRAFVSLVPDALGRLPYDLLPVFYGCQAANGEIFWVCVYSTYGRVTQIFFPERAVVVFDMFQGEAEAVLESLHHLLAKRSDYVSQSLNTPPNKPKCIALLDMLTNFGHQAINHLSGLQRLIDLQLLGQIDELWVCGVLFFGDIESLFPEVRNRVRYFPDRWMIASELTRGSDQLIRIGSTFLSAGLRRRIVSNNSRASQGNGRRVLIVTVRAAGRRCVNLPEIISKLYEKLRNSCNLKIALDGWVFPESSLVASSSTGAAISAPYVNAIRAEMALACEIESRLPHGTIIANTIGCSMLESLDRLASYTCYFSHVGTLQHKLGMLLQLPGVVHGPTVQVVTPEGGPYMCEDGVPPAYILGSDVRDISSTSSRGQAFSDYEITDLEFSSNHLLHLMQSH